jgi:hypothetical protein
MKYIAMNKSDLFAGLKYDKDVSTFKQNYENSISLFYDLL